MLRLRRWAGGAELAEVLLEVAAGKSVSSVTTEAGKVTANYWLSHVYTPEMWEETMKWLAEHVREP